jgi:hypothetical protein
MRSIRTGTLVLTIAGLVDAQNRRLLTDYDLSSMQDLASTDMGEEMATAFINKVCEEYYFESEDILKVHGAINVETNATMRWEEYREGPGLNGDPEHNHANYPWSTVTGTCNLVLQSTWVTDRDVVYGVWTSNIDSLPSQRMPVSIYLLTPKTTANTTLPSWAQTVQNIPDTEDYLAQAKQGDSKSLVNSMVWNPAGHFRRHTSLIPVESCTQTRFTAVSAMRTIKAVQVFHISRYDFAWRIIEEGRWVTWDAGRFSRWVKIWKEGTGLQEWVNHSFRPLEWKTIYSSGGYVRADGPALLTPVGTMNVQVESRALPPEACK